MSVRGRKFCKPKKKAKGLMRETETLQKETSTILKAPNLMHVPSTPKVVFTTKYEGPVIADLVEELKSTYTSLCQQNEDVTSHDRPSSTKTKKKKKEATKVRVQKSSDSVSSKSDVNHRRSSVNRKGRGKRTRNGILMRIHRSAGSIATNLSPKHLRTFKVNTGEENGDDKWDKNVSEILRNDHTLPKIVWQNKMYIKSNNYLDFVSSNKKVGVKNTFCTVGTGLQHTRDYLNK